MSNWSKVILCWSSIDDKAPSLKTRLDEIDAFMRLRFEDRRLDTNYDWEPVTWHKLSAGAADGDDTTMACEHVAVGSIKNWDPGCLMVALRELPWEREEEVEVLWKSEGHTTYQRLTPEFS
jgi:hypothetical protein